MRLSSWLYHKLQKDLSPKHYLHLCIQDAYRRNSKIPFYQHETYMYEEFNSSTYLQKIIIEIYKYEYVIVTIYFNEEEELEKVKCMLDMKDGILTPHMLSYYKYSKIAQMYSYYSIHTLFYITYVYYSLQIIQSLPISYNVLWILPLFHWLSEKMILCL